MNRRNLSVSIAGRLIDPAIKALSAIEAGEVNVMQLKNLRMVVTLEGFALKKGIRVPEVGNDLNFIIEILVASFETGEVAVLDDEVITRSMQRVRCFKNQMGHVRDNVLIDMIDDLILIAGFHELQHSNQN